MRAAGLNEIWCWGVLRNDGKKIKIVTASWSIRTAVLFLKPRYLGQWGHTATNRLVVTRFSLVRTEQPFRNLMVAF